jgi:GalNAc-alpha-(1->4)-GalNAc-alpha-(1->3)-diNAcBac-PP-undecaprenol alpha-1,4-N-acetyl-D-galactosaminyltransferase
MKNSNKRIALVLPTLHAGGMERVMSELANYFSEKENVEVYLILFSKSPKLFYKLGESVNIRINKSTKFAFKPLQAFQSSNFLRNEIKKIQPSVVLSFGTQWNNFVLLSLLGVKISVFISDRGSPLRRYKWSTELLKSILYPRAQGFIAQTNKAAEVTSKRFPNLKIVVIGNPILEIKNDFNRQENIILSVGRLIDSKHHDRLIRLFAKLAINDWKLVIVGGNALKQSNAEKLRILIDELNLQDKVVLALEQKNVEEFYKKSKIFAFCSSVEGFPNVIGEAMSAGLPVVAYDCVAGPSDMIADGRNGYLIPLFDDLMFEEKLRYLMENEEERQRMGVYARESIRKFSVEIIGEEFYRFLLNEN